MTTDNYTPSTALTCYFPSRTERTTARLWANEKSLHDLAAAGLVSFFEGPGTTPVTLTGYSPTKIWLRTSGVGVTTTSGTALAWNGVAPATAFANWVPVTPALYLQHLGYSAAVTTADYSTRAALAAATVPLTQSFVRIAGYTAPGDGGGALYRSVGSEPSHLGKVQSTDGRWWELSEITVFAEMFGAVADYNPADGSGTDNAPAINAAFGYGDAVHLKGGYYKTESTVVIPPLCALRCDESGYTSSPLVADYWTSNRVTALVPRGLSRVHTFNYMITDCPLSGGVLTNPSSAHTYTTDHGTRLDNYRLMDFSNANASGATAATARAFSAAVKMGRGSLMDGIGIRTTDTTGAFDVASATTNWGQEIDVGVLALNAFFGSIRNCVISWAFRDAAVLCVTDDETGDSPDYHPQTDRLGIDSCLLEGHVCLAVRGPDVYRVSDVDTLEIRIKWHASHRFPSNGSLTIGTTSYAYSGLTFDGGTSELVFAVASSVGVSVGTQAIMTTNNRSFGTGGLWVNNSFLKSFTHASLIGSTDDFFAAPRDRCAKLIELAGNGVRGIHFSNCYFHSREDIFFFMHDCGDVYFTNCYHEGKTLNSGGLFYNCGRCIALSIAERAARSVAEPIGDTGNIHFIAWSQTESGTDMRPAFRTVTNYGRFGTGNTMDDGLFAPEVCSNDAYNFAGSVGQRRDIRYTQRRTEDHPFNIRDHNNEIACSIDGNRRVAFGYNIPLTADLPYSLCLYSGATSIMAAINTLSAATTGFLAENTAGAVDFRVDGTGQAIIRTGGTTRLTLNSGFIGTQTSMLANHADDAAAAAGGVLVGQWYRTGSTIKIRVA